MSLSSDVRLAWLNTLFPHADVAAFTDKVFGYEITEVSESEIEDLYFEQEVNFFECLVSREVESRIMGGGTGAQVKFTVEVRYTVQKDTAGEAHQAITDALETVTAVAESTLGSTWQSTVDFFHHQEGPPEIAAVDIAGTPCWRGSYKFFGTQQTSL